MKKLFYILLVWGLLLPLAPALADPADGEAAPEQDQPDPEQIKSMQDLLNYLNWEYARRFKDIERKKLLLAAALEQEAAATLDRKLPANPPLPPQPTETEQKIYQNRTQLLQHMMLEPLMPQAPDSARPPELPPNIIAALRIEIVTSPLWNMLVLQNDDLRETMTTRLLARSSKMLLYALYEMIYQGVQPTRQSTENLLYTMLYSRNGMLAQEIFMVNEMVRLRCQAEGWIDGPENHPQAVEEIISGLTNAGARFHKREQADLDVRLSVFYKQTIIERLARTERRQRILAIVNGDIPPPQKDIEARIKARLEGRDVIERTYFFRRGTGMTISSAMFSASLMLYHTLKALWTGNPLFIESTAQQIWSWQFQASFALFGAAANAVSVPLNHFRTAVIYEALIPGQYKYHPFYRRSAERAANSAFGKALVDVEGQTLSFSGRAFFRVMGHMPLVAGAAVNRAAMILMTLPQAKLTALQAADEAVAKAETAEALDEALRGRVETITYIEKLSGEQWRQVYAPAEYVTLLAGAELSGITVRLGLRGLTALHGALANMLGPAGQLSQSALERLVFRPERLEAAVAKGIIDRTTARMLREKTMSRAGRALAAELLVADVVLPAVSEAAARAGKRVVLRLVMHNLGRALAFATSATPQGRAARIGMEVVVFVAAGSALHAGSTITFFGWLDLLDSTVFRSLDIAELVDTTQHAIEQYQSYRSALAVPKPNAGTSPDKIRQDCQKILAAQNAAEASPAGAKLAESDELYRCRMLLAKERTQSIQTTLGMFNAALEIHRQNKTYRNLLGDYVQQTFNTTLQQYTEKLLGKMRNLSYPAWLFGGGDYDEASGGRGKSFGAVLFEDNTLNWHPPLDKFRTIHPCYDYTAGLGPEKLQTTLVPPSELYDYFRARKIDSGMSRDWFLYLVFRLRREMPQVSEAELPETFSELKLKWEKLWKFIPYPSFRYNSVRQIGGSTLADDSDFNFTRLLALREKVRALSKFPDKVEEYPTKPAMFADRVNIQVADRSFTDPHLNQECLEAWEALKKENTRLLSRNRILDPTLQQDRKTADEQLTREIEAMAMESQQALDGRIEQLFTAPRLRDGAKTNNFLSGVLPALNDFIANLPVYEYQYRGTEAPEHANHNYAAHRTNLYAYATNHPLNLPESFAEEFNFWAEELGFLLADSRYARQIKNDILAPLATALRVRPTDDLSTMDSNAETLRHALLKNSLILVDDLLPRLKMIRSSGRIPPSGLVVGCLLLEQVLPNIIDEYWAQGTYFAYNLKARHKQNMTKTLMLANEHPAVAMDVEILNPEQMKIAEKFPKCTDAAYGTDIGFNFDQELVTCAADKNCSVQYKKQLSQVPNREKIEEAAAQSDAPIPFTTPQECCAYVTARGVPQNECEALCSKILAQKTQKGFSLAAPEPVK